MINTAIAVFEFVKGPSLSFERTNKPSPPEPINDQFAPKWRRRASFPLPEPLHRPLISRVLIAWEVAFSGNC